MPQRSKTDPLVKVMQQLQQLAKRGQRDEFAAYCNEITRQYGKDNEALMRLARFCQKQRWHGGFELFMSGLADRLPHSRAGIYFTVARQLLNEGRRRGLRYLKEACAAALVDEYRHDDLLQQALRLAIAHLTSKDDWEDEVLTFPKRLQGQLFLGLAEKWGVAAPGQALRAYRRALRVEPDLWPGEAFGDIVLANARALKATDPAKAMRDLLWAAGVNDDIRLLSEAAAVALDAGDKAEALRLSRVVFQQKPDDLDNLGRLARLQSETGSWSEVVALAPAIIVAVGRLNPWQRHDYAPAVDLALEAWLRTGQKKQVKAALQDIHLGDDWHATWQARLQRE